MPAAGLDLTDLERLLTQPDLGSAATLINEVSAPDAADELGRLDHKYRALGYLLLEKDHALAVFELLGAKLQRELIDDLRDETVSELVTALDPDDRASLMHELPATVVRRLLSGLSPDERGMTLAVLGYPDGSIGRRMTPEVLSLPSGVTVAEAWALVRAGEPGAETIYMMPVVGPGRVVRGVVSLRRLLISDPASLIDDVMSAPIVVQATLDQEQAAIVVREHGAVAVPVVDTEDRLLGVLTVDDSMRILEEEESEDTARVGGTTPLGRPYLSTSVRRLVQSRIGWLLVLIVAATLTVNVLDYFEDTLTQVVTLALFVPLLIGTGGNVGSQSATTVLRAIALDEVRAGDVLRVLGREVRAGAAIGMILGALAYAPALLVADARIAAVLSLSLLGICVLAAAAGSLIPLAAKRIGVDPAVVSAPFISTVVDASGLVLYFLVAHAVLGLP